MQMRLAFLFVSLTATATAGITISVNQTEVHSGDWVTVTWTGVDGDADVRDGCWLGLISPADADVSAVDPTQYPAPDYMEWSVYSDKDMPWIATVPVKFITCSDADVGFPGSGSGEHSFRLINRRHTAAFWLFLNGTSYSTPQVKTQSIAVADPAQPQYQRISRTSDPGEMRVMWNSANVNNPAVQWGIAPGSYDHTTAASSDSYRAEDMCGQPARKDGFFDPGHIHSAVLTGLPPATQLYYIVGDDEDGWTAEASFTSASPPKADAPARILVLADVGATEPDSSQTHWSDNPQGQERQSNITLTRVAQAEQADALLHIGDLSYATGFLAKWDLFLHEIQPVASRTPFMVQQGNHERDWPGTASNGGSDSGGECGVPTRTHFHMPTPSDGQAPDDSWYSFDVGSAHVVMMDTERDCATNSAQGRWLETDLGAVNRSVTPWLIFGGHRPIYYVEGDGGVGPELKDFCLNAAGMEELLMKHRVDVALWGHVHNVVRTCPLYNGTCVQPAEKGGYDAPVHVVVGHGGQNKGAIPSADKMPSWAVFAANPFGFADITVHNSTHLTMRVFENLPETHLDPTLGGGHSLGAKVPVGTVVDEFTIYRTFPRLY